MIWKIKKNFNFTISIIFYFDLKMLMKKKSFLKHALKSVLKLALCRVRLSKNLYSYIFNRGIEKEDKMKVITQSTYII
jgi:hypothetical protein